MKFEVPIIDIENNFNALKQEVNGVPGGGIPLVGRFSLNYIFKPLLKKYFQSIIITSYFCNSNGVYEVRNYRGLIKLINHFNNLNGLI